MKKYDHTLLANKLFLGVIFICLFYITISSFWMIFFLIAYLFIIRKEKLLIFVFSVIITISFLSFRLKEITPSKIDSSQDDYVGVVESSTNNKSVIKINNEKVLLYLGGYTPGDVITIKGKMKEPVSASDPTLFNYKNYLKYKDIKYIIYPNKVSISYHRFHINQISFMINKYIESIETEETKNYLSALILGIDDNMDSDFKEGINKLGISHLFVISGLHVGLMVGLINTIFRKRMTEKGLFILSSLFLASYCILTGFSSSILRVSLFFLLSGIGKIKKMPYSETDYLSLSFILLVLINPYYLFQIGFILTYLVSFGIFLSSNFMSMNKFKSIIITSIISNLLTLPIIIFMNGKIGVFGFIYNAILVGYFISIIIPLSFISVLFPFLISYLGFFFSFFSRLISILQETSLEVVIPKFSIFAIVVYYILLYLLFFAFERQEKRIRRVVYLLVFIFIYSASSYYIPFNRVYFFDVLQGDSSLIALKNNSGNILIDAYGDVLEEIRGRGINRIDCLILTHSHDDHIKEARKIIDNLDVREVIVPAYYNGSELEEVVKYAKIRGIKILSLKGGDSIKVGFLRINVLSPFHLSNNENNNSLVLSFSLDNEKYLFMADAEEEVEEQLVSQYGFLLDSDILKVGHHGSKTSSTSRFISYVSPKIAFISCGEDNYYGFPHEEAICSLKEETSMILETKKEGTIFYHKNGIIRHIYHILFL